MTGALDDQEIVFTFKLFNGLEDDIARIIRGDFPVQKPAGQAGGKGHGRHEVCVIIQMVHPCYHGSVHIHSQTPVLYTFGSDRFDEADPVISFSGQVHQR